MGVQDIYKAIEGMDKETLCLKSGQLLFEQNSQADGFYFINKGAVVQITEDSKGNKIVICESRAGSMVGLNTMIRETTHPCHAVAKGKTEVFNISQKSFNKTMSTHTVASHIIMLKLFKQLDEAEKRISDYQIENEKRIVDAIHVLSNIQLQTGTPVGLTYEQISGTTGISIQDISMIIADFQKRKLVTKRDARIVPIDVQCFKTLFSQGEYAV